MGKSNSAGADAATNVVSGTFTGTGRGATFIPKVSLGDEESNFNVWLSGTFAATVVPERSFDGGVSWVPFCYTDFGSPAWTTRGSTQLVESEPGVIYSLNCTSFSSGTVNWRFSQ